MNIVNKSLIDLIGNTPMLKVDSFDTGLCELYLKLENQNPPRINNSKSSRNQNRYHPEITTVIHPKSQLQSSQNQNRNHPEITTVILPKLQP